MKYHGTRMTLKEGARHVRVTPGGNSIFLRQLKARARRERDCGKAYLKVIPKGSRCKLRGTCGRHVEVEHRTLSSTSPTGWNFIVLGPQSWHTASLSLSLSLEVGIEGRRANRVKNRGNFAPFDSIELNGTSTGRKY